MTSLRKKVRDLVERAIGKYYEGPSVPVRLREQARLFAHAHPLATPEEWEEFAVSLADVAYRDGYVRGFEWSERSEDKPTEDEQIAEAMRHDWSLADASPQVREIIEHGDPNDPLWGVSPEHRAEFFDRLGEIYGTHRVVVVVDDEQG